MTLPGGPASKLGHRYEKWWTVAEVIRLLNGDSQSIRIEHPKFEKAEFVVTIGDHREFHQAKRSHPTGKWSINALGKDGLLQTIGRNLEGNHDRFIFVSGSDVPELSDLCEAANNAESIEEFKSVFIVAHQRSTAFQDLLRIWGCEESVAFEYLRRIEIRIIGESDLKQKSIYGIRSIFIDDPEKLLVVIADIVENSVHHTIKRDGILEILKERSYTPRQLITPKNAVVAIQTATDSYLECARNKLIQGCHIPSSAAQELLNRLNDSVIDSVLTGRAGSGKTACMIQFVESLRELGYPVFAFRLDRLPPLHSTTGLGQYLNLEESPVYVLHAAAKFLNMPCVLIIDQLDACSTLSGRHSGKFDLVEQLLLEAQAFRPKVSIHTVVVCREFDWKYDARIQNLIPKDGAQVQVTEFTLQEVESVLTKSDFDPNKFHISQLELLCLPQNLSLFLDSNFDVSQTPSFNTTIELYERYWNEKRELVAERVPLDSDQWMKVVETLCSEFNLTHQLSVAKEKLDDISSVYLKQMASEGVITFDGQRYGFGHESFFDYCFARIFVRQSESLESYLGATEQHLFHRAQVRQVLVYLRDADFDRYVLELNNLLSCEKIRPHIKDLVFVLLANVRNPTQEEWDIWLNWIQPAIEAIEAGIPNQDQLSARAWQRFFGSQSWFVYLDQNGIIKKWLDSDNFNLSDIAVSYLRTHHNHSPDRVSTLLEPYADYGEFWSARLRRFMELALVHTSRRLFDLFLKLVDNGTLDHASGSIAANSTFWSMLYGLEKTHIDWIPEVLASRLRRRFKIVCTNDAQLRSNQLIGHDRTAVNLISKAAEDEPTIFVTNVLPVVLEISDSNLKNSAPPKHDSVWPSLIKSKYSSGEQACLQALAGALTNLAKSDSTNLPYLITQLRQRDSHVANYLLLALYKGNASLYADEVIELFCSEPWRFQCGFSDSPNWCSMEVIELSFTHCAEENRTTLENTILNYYSSYERSKHGYKVSGLSQYNLLSAIPEKLRSNRANSQFKELGRKFPKPQSEPRGVTGGWVKSPIEKSAADKMIDDQWLNAISKYQSEKSNVTTTIEIKGGATELARDLETRVAEDPERFARLSLKFPSDSNPIYLDRTLASIKNSAISSDLKLEVCFKAFEEAREFCGQSIVDVLGNIKEPLETEAVTLLHQLATDYGNSDSSSGQTIFVDDLHTIGINTTRGRAAIAIQNLILHDPPNVELFRPTLECMVHDSNAAVLTCVAGTLISVAYRDPALGTLLFQKLNLRDDQLLADRNVYEFIRGFLVENFDGFKPILERMIRSPVLNAGEAGARLICLANLSNQDVADLVNEALIGGAHLRLGVAQVASANIAHPECRNWCETTLAELFNDKDADVRREAASCFRELESESLDTYEDLFANFCDSSAFQDDSFSVTHALENSLELPSSITSLVCNKFLNRFAHQFNDFSQSRFGHTRTIVKLVFRFYQQYLNGEWAVHALALIDRLCLEGIIDLESEFEQFER